MTPFERLRSDVAAWPLWRKLTFVGFVVSLIVSIVAIANASEYENVTNVWDDIAIGAGVLAAVFGGLTLGSPAGDG